jgi:hypothetical protein
MKKLKKLKLKVQTGLLAPTGNYAWQQVDAFAYTIGDDQRTLTLLVPVGNDLVEAAVLHFATGIRYVRVLDSQN